VYTAHPTLLIGPSDWQAERMPQAEFEQRIGSLWRVCPAASCAIVYGDRVHHAELAYLTNLTPKLEAAVAVISASGEHAIYVGGGPNMIGAALPLTWIKALMPLRDGKAIGQRSVELGGARAPILIGSGYMPTHLRQAILEGIGGNEPVQDATQQLWTLMRRTSSYELLAIRETSLALSAAMQAIAGARRTGAGPATAILAGERAASARGAQDVRTLYSVNGGRTLQPFTSAEDIAVDPLQVYVAVRRFNYWAEGFAFMTERRLPVAEKATELLRMAQVSIKAGIGTAHMANWISAAARPYRAHPVTERSFTHLIGPALEEAPYTDAGATFETGQIYTVKVGLTDNANSHAIVSAMIRVRDDGADVLWSALQ
jgi:hypothetical protein